jgi:hypothetical protein
VTHLAKFGQVMSEPGEWRTNGHYLFLSQCSELTIKKGSYTVFHTFGHFYISCLIFPSQTKISNNIEQIIFMCLKDKLIGHLSAKRAGAQYFFLKNSNKILRVTSYFLKIK